MRNIWVRAILHSPERQGSTVEVRVCLDRASTPPPPPPPLFLTRICYGHKTAKISHCLQFEDKSILFLHLLFLYVDNLPLVPTNAIYYNYVFET